MASAKEIIEAIDELKGKAFLKEAGYPRLKIWRWRNNEQLKMTIEDAEELAKLIGMSLEDLMKLRSTAQK